MAEMEQADLHMHTTASDGVHPPRDVVRMAKEAGLAAIAVTDHDTIAGLAEARAEGAKLGIAVVAGVEISTSLSGKDIHVLGYFVDDKDETFRKRLAGQRETRAVRNRLMLEKLGELGIRIGTDELLRAASRTAGTGGPAENRAEDADVVLRSIGRPHIAQVLVEKGIVSSVREAFERYLREGGAAYVAPPRIAPGEAVRWIREAGGKAVLAHPGLYGDDDLVIRIVSEGIDGIEAYHSEHTPEQEARYAAIARRFGLAVTAGSDFHGVRNGELLHGRIGDRRMPLSALERLKG